MLGLRHARARPRMTSLHHHHRSLHRWPVAVVGGGPVGMMTSLLLARFGVKSILLEASESGGGDTGSIRMHPRAHVMHPRAMEVLRQVGLEKEICEIMPPSEHWRRFRYCKSLTGDDYASVDHLRTKEYAMQLKISPCRAGQLSQPLLEKIVSNKTEQMAQQVGSEIHYGRRVKSLRKEHDTLGNSFVRLECGGNETVVADYVVACDGARSTLRNSLGVEMVGEHDMEAFASLHFRSKKLGKVMEEENKGAMLSFIFNDKVIGVVVSHDMRLGEWIIHVPFFPPIQTFDSICSDNTAIERVIRSFITGMPERPQHVDDPLEDLEIQSARAWGMHGICASRFSDEENRIFLVGDAAHQFPPSGGFGVNAGIVDAHNLAWKLAHVVLGRAGPELLETYDQERRPVIQDALSVAIDNYRRGLSPARALGLERSSMVTWVSLISSLNVGGASSFGEEVRRGLVDALFVGGKQHLAVFPANVFHQRVDEVVNKKQEALPLFFPRTDKGFVYSASRAVLSSPSSSPLSPSLGADVADPSEAFWLRPCFPRDHQTKWDASRVYTGMIFPHAWLSPHTSSPSLISTLDLIAWSLPDWTIMCSSVHVAKQVLQQANKRNGIRIVALVSPDDENNGDDEDDLEVFKFVSKNVDLFQGTQVALVRPDAHVAWSGIADSLSSALSHFHAHHIIQPLQ